MKKYAVIVAAGSGMRMGAQAPKQFLLLRGKTVIWHTLNVFLEAYTDLEIILVLPEEHLNAGRAIVASFADAESEFKGGADAGRIHIVGGGETRFHSVRKGLEAVPSTEQSVIFVHDGVRCLLTAPLIHRCYEGALQYGSAIPVVDSKDSVRLMDGGEGTTGAGETVRDGERIREGETVRDGERIREGETVRDGGRMRGSKAVDRKRVKLVQTPQTFLSELILPAYDVEYHERFTDEATVVEAYGRTINLVEGELTNIKITTPMDLVIAEEILKKED